MKKSIRIRFLALAAMVSLTLYLAFSNYHHQQKLDQIESQLAGQSEIKARLINQ